MGRKGDFVCKKGVREKRKTEKGNRYRKKGEIQKEKGDRIKERESWTKGEYRERGIERGRQSEEENGKKE